LAQLKREKDQKRLGKVPKRPKERAPKLAPKRTRKYDVTITTTVPGPRKKKKARLEERSRFANDINDPSDGSDDEGLIDEQNSLFDVLGRIYANDDTATTTVSEPQPELHPKKNWLSRWTSTSQQMDINVPSDGSDDGELIICE